MLIPHTESMTNYQEAFFNLAGEGNFYGIHNPADTWNGFANPLFTLGVVQKIAQLVKEQNSESADEITDELVVDGEGNVTYFYAEDGTTETMPNFLIDGKVYYSIMNYGWCWGVNSEKVKDAPKDEASVGSEV